LGEHNAKFGLEKFQLVGFTRSRRVIGHTNTRAGYGRNYRAGEYNGVSDEHSSPVGHDTDCCEFKWNEEVAGALANGQDSVKAAVPFVGAAI
jgi:hypothetical protein